MSNNVEKEMLTRLKDAEQINNTQLTS